MSEVDFRYAPQMNASLSEGSTTTAWATAQTDKSHMEGGPEVFWCALTQQAILYKANHIWIRTKHIPYNI